MSGIPNVLSYQIDENKTDFHLNEGNYSKISILGEGNFGQVFLVKKKDQNLAKNSNIFALKICKKYKVNSSPNKINQKPNKILPTEIKELSTFSRIAKIKNIHLMKLEDWTINNEENELSILMKYFPTELKTYFSKNINIVNENFLKNITHQILSGLNALHKNRIIHCDIKPENILYDPDTNLAQITDYGLCRSFDFDIKRNYGLTGGTFPYMAPEILLGSPLYFTSIDIWSLGCMLVEFCTGKVIFDGNDSLEVLKKISDIFGPIKNYFPGYIYLAQQNNINLPEKEGKGLINFIKENQRINFQDNKFYDIISKILYIDPLKRIKAEEAMKHKWLLK